ncbi:baseplate J/gp47 family protein [Gracilibacillus alcaliphilus]|uniref:baseplate J/gp47 family protein n=1 Tax=Gracilibacillus alcaliphilus TaxID=1401441 RepID=UPI00195EFD97|nr:baseplate J/gp47 family protein [Gracilibacillus alcaliphilus]MBM7678980.1 putative phage protein gp47/JayE [Gracilibacillus alcaliphilus]
MEEEQSYEAILERMLERVPADIDKRENSVIWNALAPAAAELAMSYIWMNQIPTLAFADTSEGEYLERRTAEFGTNRKRATAAVRRGLFYGENETAFDIPIGSRFFIDDLHYMATERLSAGQYSLTCEELGTQGNNPNGALLSLNTIPGLEQAIMTDIIAAGEEEESDESLRSRHYQMVNEPAFGGNISDYRHKINAITGVGGTKVFPTWNGGGSVKCVFIGANFLKPDNALVSSIQDEIDPEVNQGQGLGVAPIGHVVTIEGVEETPIEIETSLTLESGVSIRSVEDNIKEICENYMHDLRQMWENEPNLVVRTSQIEARILNVSGVLDVADTLLNGQGANVEIGSVNIPMLEGVVLNESTS